MKRLCRVTRLLLLSSRLKAEAAAVLKVTADLMCCSTAAYRSSIFESPPALPAQQLVEGYFTPRFASQCYRKTIHLHFSLVDNNHNLLIICA